MDEANECVDGSNETTPAASVKVGNVIVNLVLGVDGSKALVYTCGTKIDVDGAPNAYGPHDLGLDYSANAGHEEYTDKNGVFHAKHYPGVVTDSNGDPIVQGLNDPYPGMWVSQTAMSDPKYPQNNPKKYVDATKVNYFVISPNLEKDLLGDGTALRVGDLGVVLFNGKIVGVIGADVGNHDEIGEIAMATADSVGINSNPRHGGNSGGVTFVLFPNSRNHPPWTRDSYGDDALALFAKWGGLDRCGLLNV